MRDAAESAPAEGWGRGGAGEQGPGSLPTGAVHGPVCVRGTRVGAAALCACVCVSATAEHPHPAGGARDSCWGGLEGRGGGVRLPPRPPPPRGSSTVFPGGQGSDPPTPPPAVRPGRACFWPRGQPRSEHWGCRWSRWGHPVGLQDAGTAWAGARGRVPRSRCPAGGVRGWECRT